MTSSKMWPHCERNHGVPIFTGQVSRFSNATKTAAKEELRENSHQKRENKQIF